MFSIDRYDETGVIKTYNLVKILELIYDDNDNSCQILVNNINKLNELSNTINLSVSYAYTQFIDMYTTHI
jgi:hypothetical protein